jgi:tRNA U34 5-methylaminomethyl-2-thiouridine-forming methyltransferase MnmC
MVNDFSLVRTADGSETLYSAILDESYHSLNGAIQESIHVFIQAGLQKRQLDSLSVFEVGFGTGLNALLTWQEAEEKGLHVYYETIEAYPLSPSLYEQLTFKNACLSLPSDGLLRLHQCEWGECIQLSPVFSFCKRKAFFDTFRFDQPFDVVYYDAFSPEKQPELWTERLFQTVYDALNPNGIVVTYCAKGAVRRAMQHVGFQTERLPGPPGKREMLRATRCSY